MRIWSRLWLAACCALLAGGLFGHAAAADRLPAAVAKAVDRDVKRVLQRYGVPGAAVMVLQHGQVQFVGTYGFRDVEHHLPVEPDSFFEIGSITKQFTAASILQLQEAGKLQIDRPLSTWLPNAPHAKEVTLRQLLTHTSGLHDCLTDAGGEIDPLASRPISYHDLIARVAALPLDFLPGTRWSYSNTNYVLLGRVIETVSGETYRAYLQHHILDPLGMKRTYTMADENHLANMAIGYRHIGAALARAPVVDASWAGAAGFLVAPLSDLAKWDNALSGGKVVSQEDYRAMTTSFTTTKGESTDYGFGFFLNPVFGEPRIGHTGGSNGYTTADEYFPRQDIRIIAFTNLGDDKPEAGEAITNVVFADLYPAIAAKALAPARGEVAAISKTVRDAFRELQTGQHMGRFGPRLRQRLAGGIGARFAGNLGPYGTPTAEIFKGKRRDGVDTWYDYLMEFGPGVSLPFAVKVDRDFLVTGLSVG